jgi:hypothetical protein
VIIYSIYDIKKVISEGVKKGVNLFSDHVFVYNGTKFESNSEGYLDFITANLIT